MGRNSRVRKAGRSIRKSVKNSPGHQIANKITGRRGKSKARNQAVKTAQQSVNQQAPGAIAGPNQTGGKAGARGKGVVNPNPKGQERQQIDKLQGQRQQQINKLQSQQSGQAGTINGKNKSSQKPVPGRGRGKGGRPIAPNENRMGGGGYRNKAFGMGRQQRGYGMGNQGFQGGNTAFGMGNQGRGMGMGNAEAAAMQGFGSQMGERSFGRPQGRPNPYAGGPSRETMSMAGNTGGPRGWAPNHRGGGGGRPQAPSSSFNPQSGRMEYAQTPNNFSRSSQRPATSAFGSRRSAAFPNEIRNFMSDMRMKEKIQRMGTSPSGIPIYEFNYIGDNNRYSGVMAQDLIEMNIDAVSMDDSGFYAVNYNNIDVDMHLIN
jgi:hypothetical protein